MRRFTLQELVDRGRQGVLSRAEAIPCFRKWIQPCLRIADAVPFEAFERIPALVLPPELVDLSDDDDRPPLSSVEEEQLRRLADGAATGRFSFLGMQELSFGWPIDWHLEPLSGRRSPLVAWKRLDSLDPSLTGDRKIVWELNRHQHLPLLGCAFRLLHDDRYAAAIGDQMTSWMRHNPPGMGINWSSSLEVAFRCISWLWAMALIRRSSSWASLPFRNLARYFQLQGSHIERYLSTFSSPNTHLTGEALALYYLGTCLPDLDRAAKWRTRGRAILLEQLETQVRPDGVYFEQSTWYHRYTADFYVHFMLLAERSEDRLPPFVRERVIALLDHLMWITRPDGTSPLLGDDDGGKLITLDVRQPGDWRALLSTAAAMFGRADYKHVAGKFSPESYWLLGPAGTLRFESISAAAPDANSRAFPDGGYFVMRSGWKVDSKYMVIDCGPHGVGNCGHSHADALSIEVAAMGSSMLVDPGTFTYTGSAVMRDLFRSTPMHNTVAVDGLSSSVAAGPFKWSNRAGCSAYCWHDHATFTFFQGCHDGYERLDDPVSHLRSVFFVDREYWVVLDDIRAKSEHDYQVHYHMPPAFEAKVRNHPDVLEAQGESVAFEVAYHGQAGDWSILEAPVSPCYGRKVKGLHATYAVRACGPVALLAILVPSAREAEAPEVRSLTPDFGKGFTLSTPHNRDVILWSGRSAPEQGVDATDFEWVWLRWPDAGARLERAVCLHGTKLHTQDLQVDAKETLSFIAVRIQQRTISLEFGGTSAVRVQAIAGFERLSVNGRDYFVDSSEPVDLELPKVATCAEKSSAVRKCRHVRN